MVGEVCINCGAVSTGFVIINTTPELLSMYLEWIKDKEGLCLKCWSEKRDKRIMDK